MALRSSLFLQPPSSNVYVRARDVTPIVLQFYDYGNTIEIIMRCTRDLNINITQGFKMLISDYWHADQLVVCRWRMFAYTVDVSNSRYVTLPANAT